MGLRIFSRGTLVLLGLSLALAAAELVVRAFHLAPAVGELSRERFRLSANPKIAYEPVPHYAHIGRINDWHLSGGFSEKANGLGYRDREHASIKDPLTLRLVILGDSISMGYGIERLSDVYTSIMEQSLKARGVSAEVLNFGVSGYNTEQEVETLRVKALAYRPDIVMLQFCLNDFQDTYPANANFTRLLLRERDTLEAVSASPLRRILGASALYGFITWRVMPLIGETGTRRRAAQRQRLLADTVKENLERLRQLANRYGFQVAVAIFPTADPAQEKWQALRDRITALAHAKQFYVLDLFDAFSACSLKGQLFTDLYHPTVAGHHCAGTALAAQVAQLPPASAFSMRGPP